MKKKELFPGDGTVTQRPFPGQVGQIFAFFTGSLGLDPISEGLIVDDLEDRDGIGRHRQAAGAEVNQAQRVDTCVNGSEAQSRKRQGMNSSGTFVSHGVSFEMANEQNAS
jgi:hypothetical protein